MLKVLCVLVSFFLISCQTAIPSDQQAELLGEWVSNKPLTLKSIEEAHVSVPIPLTQAFGQMAYVFEPERTTFTPVGTHGTQEHWYRWSVVESTPQYVVIEISGLGRGTSRVRFTKEHGCLGLRPEGQAFTEYFCRQ